MIEHVYNLGNQINQELLVSDNFETPDYQNLLIVGMGGSGVAGDILKLVINKYSSINVEVSKTYGIPPHLLKAKPKCLFLSYSGNTEETISAVNEALEHDLDWFAVASGGELLSIAEENNKNYVKVPTGLQPRAALGHMARAVLHYIPETIKFDFKTSCDDVQSHINGLLEENSQSDILDLSKSLASEIGNKTVVIYGGTPASFLAAQRWKTQINENAKSKAFVGYMPEIHHNEILAWEADKSGSKNNFYLIFLRDDQETDQVKKRFELTKKIIGDDVNIFEVENIESENLVKKLFHLILYGDLVSVFMADNLSIDPYDITNIENLKSMLKGS